MTTNYELIKNMTVEEMLKWFTDVDNANECLMCKMCRYCAQTKYPDGRFQFIACCSDNENCEEGINQWLQAESEE